MNQLNEQKAKRHDDRFVGELCWPNQRIVILLREEIMDQALFIFGGPDERNAEEVKAQSVERHHRQSISEMIFCGESSRRRGEEEEGGNICSRHFIMVIADLFAQ